MTKSWCIAYDLESKLLSVECVGTNLPKPKKLLCQKTKIKIMLVTFLDSREVIYKEFADSGTIFNAGKMIFNQ